MQRINEVKDTTNFRATEFACTCNTCKQLLNNYWTADQSFINLMQKLRDFVGLPFRVTCGIRCWDQKSMHSRNACDGFFYKKVGSVIVRIPAIETALLVEEYNRKNVWDDIRNGEYEYPFNGIGIYFDNVPENKKPLPENQFVHLDPYLNHEFQTRRWSRINGEYKSYREGILYAH